MAPPTSQSPAKNGLLHHPTTRAVLPFVNGGLAGMTATAIIQPIDMIKVRLQLAGEGQHAPSPSLSLSSSTSSSSTHAPRPPQVPVRPSAFAITSSIISSGRALDLYTGLSAGLLRQAVYTTARIGFFDTFLRSFTSFRHPTPTSTSASSTPPKPDFRDRALAGLSAGGLAALIGNPADLALIRMQADGLKPPASRANYTSVLDALSRITRAEGLPALWAGCLPTVARAMALNFGQLAFFAETKSRLSQSSYGARMSEGGKVLVASGVAGFFASFFSLPFDFVKTRLQKQEKAAGKKHYSGMWHCARKVVKEEGPLRFYRGFATYYVRIAPHAMITLIVADYLGVLTR